MILAVCANPSIDTLVTVKTEGRVLRAQSERRFPGGKGVHVALALAELGENVALLGFWGGATGEWIREECEKKGVRVFGPTLSGWSRTCLTLSTNDHLNETEILGLGPEVSPQDLESFRHEFAQLSRESALIAICGSTPRGCSPNLYADLIHAAPKSRCLLDCTGELLHQALKASPFGLHLNQSEAQGIGPLAKLPLVALTAGERGLFLNFKEQNLHANVELPLIHSAVGSGDCLVAGLLIALSRNLSVPDLARMAVACGGANCLREDLGLLYKKDVETLFERVSVNNVQSFLGENYRETF